MRSDLSGTRGAHAPGDPPHDEAGQSKQEEQLAEMQAWIGQLQAQAELDAYEIETLHEAPTSARRIEAAIGVIVAASKTTKNRP